MICVRFIFSSIFVLAVWIQGRSALLEDEVLFQNLNKIDKRYDLITPGRTYGFCKPPVPRSFLQIWSRSYIQFENADLVDVMYTGASEDEVRNGLKTWFPTQYMLLSHSLFRSKELNVPLFGNFCVALKPNEPTIFYLRYDQFAFRSLLMFIAGLIVFFTADFFSRQLQTFYFFGASFGAIGGCILLCFILKRFLPKQSGFIWYLFSGLFNFYILNKSRSLMFTYPYYLYLASYLVVAGFIGFGVAYYYGKSFDPRMYDIIRWVIRVWIRVLILVLV